jgi:hypothetical protein
MRVGSEGAGTDGERTSVGERVGKRWAVPSLGAAREEAGGVVESSGEDEGVDGGEVAGAEVGGPAEDTEAEGEGVRALEAAGSEGASAGDGLGDLEAAGQALGLVDEGEAPARGVLGDGAGQAHREDGVGACWGGLGRDHNIHPFFTVLTSSSDAAGNGRGRKTGQTRGRAADWERPAGGSKEVMGSDRSILRAKWLWNFENVGFSPEFRGDA